MPTSDPDPRVLTGTPEDYTRGRSPSPTMSDAAAERIGDGETRGPRERYGALTEHHGGETSGGTGVRQVRFVLVRESMGRRMNGLVGSILCLSCCAV